MKTFASGIALATLLCATAFAAQDGTQGNRENAPGQDRVCLVTFNNAQNAGAGANVNVVRARVLPRNAATAQQGGANRIFEYGAGGSLTTQACDCLNNPATRATCNQPVGP